MIISISRRSLSLSFRYLKWGIKSAMLFARFWSILSVVGRKVLSGKPNIEWMVTPPALIAAIPVGATTMCFFLVFFTKSLRNVVFPVPAFPVRKMLRLVCSTISKRELFIDSKIENRETRIKFKETRKRI